MTKSEQKQSNYRTQKRFARCAFTLAEVLIVIGVIGVVAAITIPTLINTISKNAKEAQTKTIEARLLDGINRYSATDDGLSQKYASTYDFLVGLSAHYKMSQICKADEITKCIPYSKIHSSDGKSSVDVSSLKTIKSFISGEAANNYLEPASFISAQGTPFVMALKKDCVWDMGQAMRSVEDSGCIAYMYDKNGTSLPNRLGDSSNENNDSDIISHGITIGFPLAVLGGVKIMTNAKVPTKMTRAECEASKSKYGIKACNFNTDYWAGAMKECQDLGYRLPTEAELVTMANALYKGMSATTSNYNYSYPSKDENNNYYTIGSNEPLPTALSDLGSSWSELWSGSEGSSDVAYNRHFYAFLSRRYDRYRHDSFVRAVCVGD